MEIAYFVSFCLKWGLILFFGLGAVYAGLLRFRDTSSLCRNALRVILGVWALYLWIPTLFAVIFAPFLILTAVVGNMEPFSQRITNVAAALVMGGFIVAAWWGLLRAVIHLERPRSPAQTEPAP